MDHRLNIKISNTFQYSFWWARKVNCSLIAFSRIAQQPVLRRNSISAWLNIQRQRAKLFELIIHFDFAQREGKSMLKGMMGKENWKDTLPATPVIGVVQLMTYLPVNFPACWLYLAIARWKLGTIALDKSYGSNSTFAWFPEIDTFDRHLDENNWYSKLISLSRNVKAGGKICPQCHLKPHNGSQQ